MSADRRGKVVTFYSYKGGVGRSMALANIGVLLAKMGKKILLIDWDLEAPGLEHYFAKLRKVRAAKSNAGLLSLLLSAPTHDAMLAEFESSVDVYSLDRTSEIAVLTSGAESENYTETLANFAWSEYFANQEGARCLEALRDYWIGTYDFTLLDSRTGVTDAGGICTIFMPDILLLLFAANRQNLNGVLKVADAVREGRKRLYYSRSSLPMLPIPSRFDGRVERKAASEWLDRIAVECEDLYADWLAPGVDCRTLIEQIKIPYIAEHSFDEALPVVSEATTDPDQIGYYYRNIATLLVSDGAFDGAIRPIRDKEASDSEDTSPPRRVYSVFVSSTSSDLKEHRQALLKVILSTGMKPVLFDDSTASPSNAADELRNRIKSSDACVFILGHRYGYIPEDQLRNPRRLSVAELEFEDAINSEVPVLVFIAGDDHLIKQSDIELDVGKRAKMEAFRERASSSRLYGTFNSVEHFQIMATQSMALLYSQLREATPRLPLYSVPPYVGAHRFVGREEELRFLSEWASPAYPASVLLLEGIGGGGKSILAWEWLTRWAPEARDDWCGRFWYSFYDERATMVSFCRQALSYMSQRPLEDLESVGMRELAQRLVAELNARPWLLVLDGIERVLAAYHRIWDVDVNEGATRDPRDTAMAEDGPLLRRLAGAAPSKVLMTSRLLPRALLNPSNTPIAGVTLLPLSGLTASHAEEMLRSCGVIGDSVAIQRYLRDFAGNHPLTIGVLGGLINDYLPKRGDFDAWSADAQGGLHLGHLNHAQLGRHILNTSIATLPPSSRLLLNAIATARSPLDYEELAALTAHMLCESDEATTGSVAKYRASRLLAEAIRDLERRGLLGYDHQTRQYSLHPVVRAITVAMLPVDAGDSTP